MTPATLRRPLVSALLLAAISTTTYAATNTYTGLNGGSYNTPGNWSLGIVPSNGNGGVNYDVLITAPATLVNLNAGSATVDSLTLGASSSLAIANTLSLTINNTLSNAGLLTVAAGPNITDLYFASATSTITGNGTITLATDDNSRANARLWGNSGIRLTSSNTIQGTGQIGINFIKITNTGLIVATVGQGLSIDPNDAADGFINTGTLRANGATLALQAGTYTNTGGIIEAFNASTTILNNNATVIGGTLQTSGSGQILLNSSTIADLAITGNVRVANAAVGSLSGTIANSGSITLAAAANTTDLYIATDVALTGTGALVLTTDDSSRNNARIYGNTGNRLTSANAISGAGSVGANYIKITNNNTITATVAPGIVIDPNDAADGFINNGTLAADGGPLTLIFGAYTNNGIITARNASVATITNSATVTGGTLTTSTAGQINLVNATIQNLTNAGQLVVPNATFGALAGTINSPGTITLAAGPNTADLYVSSVDVTLSGSGKLLMTTDDASRANARIYGNTGNRLTSAIPISGTGQVGINFIKITNNNTITATVAPGIVIDPNDSGDGFINNGTLAADGAPLSLAFGFYTNNGIITARNGSVTTIGGGSTVTGGSLTTSAAGQVNLVNATIQNLTNTGNLVVPNAALGGIAGTINNAGTITLAAGPNTADLHIGGADAALTGSGALLLTTDDVSRNNARIFGNSGFRLTSAIPISGTGQVGVNFIKFTNNASITATAAPGIVIDPNDAPDGFINNGTLSSNGAPLTLTTGTYTNNGVIDARNASVTTFNGNATVIGGTLTSAGTGQVNIANATIQNLTIAGKAVVPNAGFGAIVGTITTNGSLTLTGGPNTADIFAGADATLAGSGAIFLTTDDTSRNNARIYGTSGIRITSNLPISGAGQIGINFIKFTNNSSITATAAPGISIDPNDAADGFISTGTLRADGAPLVFQFGTYTLSGTIDAVNGGALTFAAGTFNIASPITFSATSSVSFNAPNMSVPAITGTGTLSVGGSLVSDTVSQNIAAWNVTGTHQLRLHTGTSKVNAVPNITGNGRLDITDNGLIIQASSNHAIALATLQGYITSGNSNNPGITSATSLADSVHRGNVVVDNALLGFTTFFGQPVDANSILIESTYKGDTNLDRKVNVTDLGVLATFYGQSAGVYGILHGDFNNDGQVNVSDLGILATDYGLGTSGPPYSLEADLATFPQFAPAAAVPEPVSLALLTPTALLLLRRRTAHARR